MDFSDIPIMQGLKSRMYYLNKRQEVLSENVANADTPRYQAKSLQKQDFSQLLEKTGADMKSTPTTAPVRMVATHPSHMVPQGDAFGTLTTVEEETRGETADGNNVVLEEQLQKVGKNQMEYGLMVNLYRKHSGLLKIAMGNRGQ